MTGRPLQEKKNTYESSEFALTGTVTNHDCAVNHTNLFGGATSLMKFASTARGKLKLITDQTIVIRYNDTANDGITVTASESPYIEEEMSLTNLFITTTQTTNVKVRLYVI